MPATVQVPHPGPRPRKLRPPLVVPLWTVGSALAVAGGLFGYALMAPDSAAGRVFGLAVSDRAREKQAELKRTPASDDPDALSTLLRDYHRALSDSRGEPERFRSELEAEHRPLEQKLLSALERHRQTAREVMGTTDEKRLQDALADLEGIENLELPDEPAFHTKAGQTKALRERLAGRLCTIRLEVARDHVRAGGLDQALAAYDRALEVRADPGMSA
ncbi:MAG: hypothetical protein HY814_10265, partial [Candidatus Riflebacteria bacterium]|nr:hypothetical protein [Candidatus Riflebacteria bacterium]